MDDHRNFNITMDSRTIGLYVLIATGVVGVIAFIFVISVFIASESKTTQSNPSLPLTVKSSTISYTRNTPKSNGKSNYSNYNNYFEVVDHPINKLHRVGLIKEPISSNHWMSDTFYQSDSTFRVYPYNATIKDNGFMFNWPGEPSLIIGSSNNNSISSYTLDVDPFVTTNMWEYYDPITDKTGSLTIPLTNGCPFITIEADNNSITITCDFDGALIPYQEDRSYIIKLGPTSGYVIFLSHKSVPKIIDNVILIHRMTGIIRIAYFNSLDILDILTRYKNTYPVESTISMITKDGNNIWDINPLYTFTTRNMLKDSTNNNLLMLSYGNHKLNNIIFQSNCVDHPILGSCKLITTSNNIWRCNYKIKKYDFVNHPRITSLTQVSNDNIVSWMKSIGNLAKRVLINTKELNTLTNELDKIRINRGVISNNKIFVYDSNWNGIVSKVGLTNSIGDSDNGNSYYNNHIGQYGHLILGYAVASHFDKKFLSDNEDIMMYFVRNVCSYSNDKLFPLWRNKDWYTGASLTKGLTYITDNDINEIAQGYFACYLVSLLLNDNHLMSWSLGMLVTELNDQDIIL